MVLNTRAISPRWPTDEPRCQVDEILLVMSRDRGHSGRQDPPPMTLTCVRSIAKQVNQRTDDRSLLLRAKPMETLPRVTVEPKNNMVVRLQGFNPPSLVTTSESTNVLQPFESWTESDMDNYVAGQELREAGVATASSIPRSIPSKRDRQFIFDARTESDGQKTANDIEVV